MPIIPLYGHDELRERLRDAYERNALPSSLLFQGTRGVGKQRLALWLGQLLLCERGPDAPCGTCQQCRFSFPLTHPDLHSYSPRPRRRDSDPCPQDVIDHYGGAVAERPGEGGVDAPASGGEGVSVASVRGIG